MLGRPLTPEEAEVIVFSQKEHFTGGKGRLKVLKLTASTPEEWFLLLQSVRGGDFAGQYWIESPTADQPWGAKVRRQCAVWARPAVVERLVAACGATAVPESYWQLCAGVLRMELWKMWCRDETGDQELWAHWQARLKWLAGQVFRSGEWVSDPEAWDGGERVVEFGYSDSGAVAAVKEWNGWIEKFDLAQRRTLKPGPRVLPNRVLPIDRERYVVTKRVRLRVDQVEYMSMTPEEREALKASKPWMQSLWRSWELEWEGGEYIPEVRTVIWKRERAPAGSLTNDRESDVSDGAKME